MFGAPRSIGAGALPVHDSGPSTVDAATIGSTSPVVLFVRTMGPRTVELTTATLPVAPVTFSGPRTVVSNRWTAFGLVAETGPEIEAPRASSDPPPCTTTGPDTVAPSRQVGPDVLVEGYLHEP